MKTRSDNKNIETRTTRTPMLSKGKENEISELKHYVHKDHKHIKEIE